MYARTKLLHPCTPHAPEGPLKTIMELTQPPPPLKILLGDEPFFHHPPVVLTPPRRPQRIHPPRGLMGCGRHSGDGRCIAGRAQCWHLLGRYDGLGQRDELWQWPCSLQSSSRFGVLSIQDVSARNSRRTRKGFFRASAQEVTSLALSVGAAFRAENKKRFAVGELGAPQLVRARSLGQFGEGVV